MRRSLAALAALAVLGASAPSALAAPDELRLTPVGTPRFPDRSYALSLPQGQSVSPARVSVTENGEPVDASISPAKAAGAKVGVVLVIDASNSMRGAPIADAMAAARVFADQRSPDQPLGVVTFNSRTETLLPLTTDAERIKEALGADPQLRRQTHIFDGVDAALAMLAGDEVTSGSVVVLSDGADTGSQIGLAEAGDRARGAGVRVFSVGLRSSAFEPGPLEAIAEGARGDYTEASTPADLAQIYEQLGSALANEHLIQYRSFAEPRTDVQVRVRVEGVGLATDSYRAPGLNLPAAAPFQRNEFWASPLTLVLVCLACGGLLALALLLLSQRPGRRRLRERVALFVSPPAQAEDGKQRRSLLGGNARGAVERGLERLDWWPLFKEELDVAQIHMDPVHFAAAAVVATLVSAWIVFAVSGVALLGLACLVLVPLVIRAFVRSRAESERRLFADQLADNLQVIASAQRAGHSFLGALTVSVQEAPQPTKREFERVLADEQLGLPLEDGLGVVAKRMNSRDLEQVILVANLQRETGGNTAEVLEQVAETVRERGELRRLVASLTAQGRMSRWIVTALPILLLVLVSALNPTYMEPLFETTGGRLALALAGTLLLVGSFVIKRIVAIRV